MKIIYYLNKNLEWVEIPSLKEDKSIAQTYPQTFTFGIDEALDAGEFSFYAPTNYHIPIDSIIKIDNDGIIKYWVVKDSKSSDMPQPNIWTQEREKINTLTLTEPTEILRGFKVEPCAFAENSYTLEQIIKRLFDIANFDAEVEIPNVEYSNPKLTYVSTTLYLAFFELAKTIDCIPYLDFNETTKKWILKFQRLDGLNGKEYDISVFTNPKEFKTDFGEGLAKNVYCEISNLKIGITRFPTVGTRNINNIDGSYKITLDNIGIKINNIVYSLSDLRLFGYKYISSSAEPSIDYEHSFFLYDGANIEYYIGNRTPTGVSDVKQKNIRIKILSYKEYNLLLNEEKENENILYIYYDDVNIYLNDLSKIWSENSVIFKYSATNEYLLEDIGGIINRPNDIDYTNLNFYVEYMSISEFVPILISNDSKYDDTTNFNQTSQQVDPDRIGRVLQTYIDNMSNGSVMKSGVFYSWADIPMPGSIVRDGNKRYLVDSITISQTSKFSNVDAQLCLERSRRREYISANSDLQLSKVPNENFISRLSLKTYKIIFSMQNNLSVPSNNIVNIKKLISDNENFRNYMFYNQFQNNALQYQLLGESTFSKIGNNIIFNEKALNNVIWDEVGDNSGIIIPYNYTNENGHIFKNSNNIIKLFQADLNDVIEYPNINNYIENEKVILEFFNFDKDPYEIFNFTFQVNYRGANNTIVREEYVDFLLNGAKSLNKNYTIKLYNINIGRYDNLPSEYATEITPVSVSEFDETNNYISVDFTSIESNYKSIVLLLNNKPIMIKNYFEEQVRLEPFKIYVATEDGTPLRTGVVGIDPTEESN